MKEKISLLFIPFLKAFFGILFGYTFVHWLIFIQLDLLPLKEMITHYVIPASLTAIVSWFTLRKKFKILDLKAKKGNWKDFYSFILWVTMSIPILISQNYIVSASGQLTELKSINDINNTKLTKYYTVNRFFIAKNQVSFHSSFDVSGKHSNNFNMHIFGVLPIFESSLEANNIEVFPHAYIGIEYRETISNRLEVEEKDKEYQKFAERCETNFNTNDFSKFIYLNRIGYSKEQDGYKNALKKKGIYNTNQIIFEAVNEPFSSRNGNKLSWIIITSILGCLIWFFMISIPKIDKKELKRIKSGKPDFIAQSELQDIIGFIKPHQGFMITPILVYLNIFIFFLMVIFGLGFITFKGQDLIIWGANYKPLTGSGEWWRLLSSTFLHSGLMHLLLNMYGLIFVGIFLEPILGKSKYLIFYLTTGISASIASMWWYDATVSVGASGSIFGMYGILLALMLTKSYQQNYGKTFLYGIIAYISISLLSGISGSIDNAAHIGGLVSGMIIGALINPFLKKKKSL